MGRAAMVTRPRQRINKRDFISRKQESIPAYPLANLIHICYNKTIRKKWKYAPTEDEDR